MSNQIAVENLQPTLHDGIKVITTELLAQLYGTTAHSITKNHRSNVERFVAGKHYFKVTGQELANLRVTFGDLQISPKARSLILWTERGAARHAKMLETDQAWEVFEKLEDFYFTRDEAAHLRRQGELLPRTENATSAYVRALHFHYSSIYLSWSTQIEPALRLIENPHVGRLHEQFEEGQALMAYLVKNA